ncbi:chitin synthase G [Apiospora rasikravindrae]|uniref:Chitin synthase n=1 Tax=Apiospora rasikravindrae TaxID=990691 RepID=A0ABR1S3J6_9PEZI
MDRNTSPGSLGHTVVFVTDSDGATVSPPQASRQSTQVRNETGIDLAPFRDIIPKSDGPGATPLESSPHHNNGASRVHVPKSEPLPSMPGDDLRGVRTRNPQSTRDYVRSIEWPVPSAVINTVQSKYKTSGEIHASEFRNMRYTPATCDPDDFTLRNGYVLRPYNFGRHTELFICVTYYNEDKILFARSSHSIMENIRAIINMRDSSFWNKGGPAWQKIVLCFAMDGLDACDQGVLDVLASIGIYQHGVLTKSVHGAETQAHIFEYTTQLSVTQKQQLIRPVDGSPMSFPPVQVILCLKAKNNGKINSNRWFLNAFGRILNPEVVVHVDTGTIVGQKSLLELWAAFYNDRYLGGACGLIRPYLGTGKGFLLKPLLASQNFEYQVACQLERAMESTTGYLSVLPGALSAYRFRAIMGVPLESYFEGDPTLAGVLGQKGAFTSLWRMNRFLADDRVLSFELCIKAGCTWHTRLVPSADGHTDCPESTIDFINQRRRWLNGSLSASLYSLRMAWRLVYSGHNILRLSALLVQMVYNLLSFLLAWFSLAGYLLTTFVNSEAPKFPFGAATPVVNAILQVLYVALMVLLFIISFGGRPESHRRVYGFSFVIFAFFQGYLFMNLVYLTKRVVDFQVNTDGATSYAYISEYYTDIGPLTVMVTGVAVFGVYIAAGFLCRDPWHLFHSWAQYLFISSSYTNILRAYAFSNIQDASWGEKAGKKTVTAVLVPGANTSPAVVKQAADGEVYNRTQEEIDAIFEVTVKRALEPYKVPSSQEAPNGGDTERDREDAFLKVRTILIAVYLFSNFFVCVLVMNDSLQSFWWLGDSYWHKIWFFRLWMWGNSVLLSLQFLGCLYQKFVSVWRYFIYEY